MKTNLLTDFFCVVEESKNVTFKEALGDQEKAYILLENPNAKLTWQQKAELFFKHRTNKNFLSAIKSAEQLSAILIDIGECGDDNAKNLIKQSYRLTAALEYAQERKEKMLRL